MGAIVPILLALNILAASVAGPTFISGLGLGSGAAGSSFKQAINKSASDVKAAKQIFSLSCDQTKWNKAKQDGEPAYPTSDDDFKDLFDKAESIGSVRFNELCQPLKDGKAGILFNDPLSGGLDNGVEMFHLFASHWDRRSLTAIYYLYQKRFTDKGYGVDCSHEGKTAPIMTLTVAAGYMDESGQPTQLAKSGFEDDKAATDQDKTISPHGRGQSVDIRTFGCTIITGDEPQVVPNQIAIGQDDKAELSEITQAALSQITSGSEAASADMQEAMAEAAEDNPALIPAGQDAAGRAGQDPVAVAADIPDPDAEPEIIVHHDPPADLVQATDGATIPDNAAQEAKKVSFEDRSAQLLERIYEKQQGLPSGSLRDGANLETIGRKALYNQTGIFLSEKPSTEEMAAAAAQLAAYKNPEAAGLVPSQAVASLRSGNYQLALKLVGANRLNAQLSLNLDGSGVSALAQNNLTGPQLARYLANNRTLSDNDKEYLTALSTGGYKALRQKLDEAQASRDQSVSGKLLNILKANPNLTETQRLAISDFLNNKDQQDGAIDRLTSSRAPQELLDWVNANKNLSDQDAATCQEIYKTYSSASDSAEALAKAYPTVHEQVAMSATSLMKPQEKLIFQSVFGTNPTTKELREGFSSGKLEQAAEAYVFSQGLTRAGIPASQATYLGIGLAQDRLNGTDVGLARVNQEVGKRLNVTLTRNDLTMFKNGNFTAGKKLAIGAIASKTKLPVQKITDYFDKKDASAKPSIAEAFSKNPKLTAETKAMLDGMLDKQYDGGTSHAAATAYAGAKAKANVIAASSAEGENKEEAEANRKSTSDKLEQAFKSSVDKAEGAAKQQGSEVLIGKGLTKEEADGIMDGQVKGAEQTVANAVVAKKIVSELPPGTTTVEQVKKVLNGKATPEERDAFKDTMIVYQLGQKGIVYTGSRSITETLTHGTDAEREALIRDMGKQYGAWVLQETARVNGVSMNREQSLEFMNSDFSQLGNVAGQSVISAGISRLTGVQISGETSARIYSAISDLVNDSPKPTTSFPSSTSSAQVGIGPDGTNSGDAALNYQGEVNTDLPTSADLTNLESGVTSTGSAGEAGGSSSTSGNNPIAGSAGTNSNKPDTQSVQATTQSRIENIGWGLVEDQLGFSRDAIMNFPSNVQNLPENFANYYKNFDYNAALSNIATGVILNKLIGNTLAKIDPTGGILSCIAMQYATTWIASLGISMPILLGISLLIDFKGTIQAIKGLVMMALQIFTDPVGAILGFLGFGKKTPKATSAAKNAVKASQQDSLDGRVVDAPVQSPVDPGANTAVAWILGLKARAAEDESEPAQIRATSNYLAAKKPSEEQFEKISRRTTDQTLEDLLLFSLAASANSSAIKSSEFLTKHWNAFMDIENPRSRSFAIKQLISPRAVITDAEVAAAKKLDMNDVLYAKESSEAYIGYKQIVNYARMLYGDDFLPSTADKRISGLFQNRAIKDRIHFAF